MADDRERRLLRDVLGRTDSCPDIEDLIAGLERGDRQVQSHSDQCPYCRNELALFQEFQDGSPNRAEVQDVRWITNQLRRTQGVPRAIEEPRVSWWQRWTSPRTLVPLGLAFACLLVMVTAITTRRTNSLSGPLRVSENETLRATGMELLQPEGQLSEAPGDLQWKPAAGASTYVVQILEVDGNPLWTATTSGTWVAIPSDIRKRIVPGKRLLWRVTARRPDGSDLITSETKSFSLQPSGDK